MEAVGAASIPSTEVSATSIDEATPLEPSTRQVAQLVTTAAWIAVP